MLGRILAEARVTPAELLETIPVEEIVTKPRPCLTLRTPRQNWGLAADRLLAELEFDYDGALIPAGRSTLLAVSTEVGLVIRRDPAAESAADVILFELGFRESKDPRVDPGTMELPAKRMDQVARDLVLAGWRVEAEGKLIRPAGEFKLAVTTGIDWFELGGQVDYGGGQGVSLPDLLAAARRGETMVTLGDGSMGMLPEDWLKKYGLLADLGTPENGALRFSTSQAALLDSLLAAQPEIQVDAAFQKVRQSLHKFEGVKPLDAPPGFHGELRPVPVRGARLARLPPAVRLRRHPRRRHGPGQDDPGPRPAPEAAVAQRTARRRGRRSPSSPARSSSTGSRRPPSSPPGSACSTTPARTATPSASGSATTTSSSPPTAPSAPTSSSSTQIEFDYVILDEAQAIKNADSQAAKAARLLRGKHRLAMSGTPIENHLGELWSIFEFLNPGMLGTSAVFKRHTSAAGMEPDERRAPGQGAAAVHPPPHQGAGRQGPPREDRADPPLRDGARPARSSTRSCRPTTARPSSARGTPS